MRRKQHKLYRWPFSAPRVNVNINIVVFFFYNKSVKDLSSDSLFLCNSSVLSGQRMTNFGDWLLNSITGSMYKCIVAMVLIKLMCYVT